jgi:cytidine deaminase
MKEVKLETKLTLYDDLSELQAHDRRLMSKAVEAREKAYAPYSNFTVGAAVMLDNEVIVTGSNQENASYPSGLCAERVAIFYAGAQYPKARIKKIAITASAVNNPTKEPIPPCGSCRQAIAEYEERQGKPIEIFFMGVSGKIARSASLSNLLPFVFKGSML